MEEKYFFLYFNVTITTFKVNMLVYSDLRVAISPIFIVTYCHLLPRINGQRAEADPFCPRTWSLIPVYVGTHTHVHGYGCPKPWVTMPYIVGQRCPRAWATVGNVRCAFLSCVRRLQMHREYSRKMGENLVHSDFLRTLAAQNVK